MKVVVIGMGYVGFPAAILLARAGHEIVGVDVNEEVVRSINQGLLHIKDEDLQEILEAPEVRGRLRGAAQPEQADAYLIAVPTPLEHPRKTADLSMVIAACEALAPHLQKGSLVVLESTVPPLTCKSVITPILEKGGLKVGQDILLAHCPERILPGNVFHEIVHNDRIIGGVDEASTNAASALYSSFVKGDLIRTDDVTAELCKLMENTYRDVNIALANELAMVCDRIGVDVQKALNMANRHPRVKFLMPGIGVGGHCIPIDPWFITEVDPESSILIATARRINDQQPGRIASLIRRAVADVAEPRILCVGATYKPDVYDLRESPAIQIVELLKEDGYDTTLVDPITREYPCDDLAAAAKGCDLLAILVPHRTVMKRIGDSRTTIVRAMRRPQILDFSAGETRDISSCREKQPI